MDDFDNNAAIIAVAMSAARIDTYRKAYAGASTSEERAKALRQQLEWLIVHDRFSRRVQRVKVPRDPVLQWRMDFGFAIKNPYSVVRTLGV